MRKPFLRAWQLLCQTMLILTSRTAKTKYTVYFTKLQIVLSFNIFVSRLKHVITPPPVLHTIKAEEHVQGELKKDITHTPQQKRRNRKKKVSFVLKYPFFFGRTRDQKNEPASLIPTGLWASFLIKQQTTTHKNKIKNTDHF